MNHRPNISKPPTAAAGCGECLAPIGGRHEWSCSQVDAATFTAALTAPRRRRWQRWLRPAEFLNAAIWLAAAIVGRDWTYLGLAIFWAVFATQVGRKK